MIYTNPEGKIIKEKPLGDQIVEGFGYGWLMFLIGYAVFITVLVCDRIAAL